MPVGIYHEGLEDHQRKRESLPETDFATSQAAPARCLVRMSGPCTMFSETCAQD